MAEKKRIKGEEGIILKSFPFEKGTSHTWTVKVTRIARCSGDGPLLSISVVTEREREDHWPCWGATKEGWAIAFWGNWRKSVFSHDQREVKKMEHHVVVVGDEITATLNPEGELSFNLNGKEMGSYPKLLKWEEMLFPAVFGHTHQGEMDVEIEIDHALNIKPAKR